MDLDQISGQCGNRGDGAAYEGNAVQLVYFSTKKFEGMLAAWWWSEFT